MVAKSRRKTVVESSMAADVAVSLPRMDVSDDDIVAAVDECGGLPTRVAAKFSMRLADLMARAKASRDIAGAFAEARHRTVDLARARALSVAVGNANTPPDPQMLRWYIERYE